MPQVVVDANTCNGCGICARVCPVAVFDIHDRKAVATRVATCMACELCVVECPTRSIFVDRLAAPNASPVARPLPRVEPAPPIAPAAAAPLSVTHAVEVLPGVQPFAPTGPTAPLISETTAPGTFPAAGIIVPQASATGPALGPDSGLADRALVVRSEPQAPRQQSPSSILPVPDSFPYIIVKKGSPESSGE